MAHTPYTRVEGIEGVTLPRISPGPLQSAVSFVFHHTIWHKQSAASSQQPATTQPINLILPPSLSITEYNQIYPQHPQALKVYLPYIVSHLSLFPPYMAHSCPLSCYQLLSLRFTAHLFIASRPA